MMQSRNKVQRKEVFVLALIKKSHRYVFLYDEASRFELIEELQQQANDVESLLTGFDVAVLAGKMREQMAEKKVVLSR